MADKTIDSELFFLFDRFSGAVNPALSIYKNPTAAAEHNVAVAKHDLGTKVALVCHGVTGKAGIAILTYLKVGTQNPDVAIAAKTLCVSDSATDPLIVTNDPDGNIGIESGLACFALSAMTDAYFGWFWTGGVCPEEYVSGMGGNYATDSTVIAGRAFSAVDLADADAMGLGTILSAAAVTQDALTDSTGGSADTTLADLLAAQTQDALTDSTGGSADTTLTDVLASPTQGAGDMATNGSDALDGTEGAKLNAHLDTIKADIATLLGNTNDNFADIDAQLVKIKADIASVISNGNNNVADIAAQLAKIKVDVAAVNTALAAFGTPIGVALAADAA